MNPMVSTLAIPGGAALVLLTLLDVALTALHIQSESPFSTRLNRLVWWVLVRICHVVPGAMRDEVLGWALPLMLASTMATWACAYIVGFALVQLPFIHDPASFSLSAPRSNLEDALFFSGTTFFNLGSGDIAPVGTLMRGITVLEGGTGLLTISLAVTYLLNVYPVLSRKVAVADGLNQVTGGRADGVLAAARYLPEGRHEALAGHLDRLNAELLYLAHAHRLYPVLYYVRSREVHESFVRILALAQGLVGTLRYGLDADSSAELVRDPRLLMLEEALLDALHLLTRSSHVSVPRAYDAEPVTRDFDELRDSLRQHGLRPVPADPRARRRYTEFRDSTEPHIRAYAQNLGYSAEAVWRTYGRAARNSALKTAVTGATAEQPEPRAATSR